MKNYILSELYKISYHFQSTTPPSALFIYNVDSLILVWIFAMNYFHKEFALYYNTHTHIIFFYFLFTQFEEMCKNFTPQTLEFTVIHSINIKHFITRHTFFSKFYRVAQKGRNSWYLIFLMTSLTKCHWVLFYWVKKKNSSKMALRLILGKPFWFLGYFREAMFSRFINWQ